MLLFLLLSWEQCHHRLSDYSHQETAPPPTFIVFQYVRKSCIHNILISLVEVRPPPQVLIVGANPLTEYTLPRVGLSNWV